MKFFRYSLFLLSLLGCVHTIHANPVGLDMLMETGTTSFTKMVTINDLYSSVRSSDRKQWAGYMYSDNGGYDIYLNGKVIKQVDAYPETIFFSQKSLFFLVSEYDNETEKYSYTLWKDNQIYLQAEKIEVSNNMGYGKMRYILSQDKGVFRLQTVSGKLLTEVQDVESFYADYDAMYNLVNISISLKDGNRIQYLGDTFVHGVDSIDDVIGTILYNQERYILFRGFIRIDDGSYSYRFFLFQPESKKILFIDEVEGTDKTYTSQYKVTKNDTGDIIRFWYTVKMYSGSYAIIDGFTGKSVFSSLRTEPSIFEYSQDIGVIYNKLQKYYVFVNDKIYGPYDSVGMFQQGDLFGLEYSSMSDWWIITRKNHKNYLLINGKEYPF